MPTPIVTRFPNGLCDGEPDGAYSNFAGLRPARYIQFWDDFLTYIAGNWVLTETAAGSTEVIVTGDGGILAITNVSAGATDEASIQWSGGGAAVVPQFTFDATKDMAIHARFKVSDVINTAFVIGLAIADTTPVASLPANGIFFNKVAASANLLANLRASAASQTVTVGAMVNDTYVTVGFVYTAATGYWQAFMGTTLIGSILAPTSPSVAVAPTIGLLNASTTAHVLSIDYMFVLRQR